MQWAPKPVYFHSFDPGGTKGLAALGLIGDKHQIYVDNSFEIDDDRNPTAFKSWEREIYKLYRSNFFNSVGTFVLDSLSRWGDAIMRAVQKEGGRAPELGGLNLHAKTAAIPYEKDYQIQMSAIAQYLGLLCSLPCHVVVLGHMQQTKDDATGTLTTAPLITGKLATRIPTLFDEVYMTYVTGSGSAAKYQYVTGKHTIYNGRTRMGANVFKPLEDQNLSEMIARAEAG